MVRCGIDRPEALEPLLRGQRCGMVTAVSAVTGAMRPGWQAIHERWPLAALFGPEHGLYGRAGAGENVGDAGTDPVTGVPVYSLYGGGAGRRIPPAVMDTLDVILYDIQDLGVRFYTYISTLLGVLEDCAAANKRLVVLDRPAPLDGVTVEGGLLEPGYESFVGAFPLCVRYGLTAGELAAMACREKGYGDVLTVVRCEGWQRGMLFPETGLLWMAPSPNIPHFSTALVYPGTCFFEGTNLSEGRGTPLPFEMIGAPYVDGMRLAREMNGRGLPGVVFTPAYFTPSASKWQGMPCEGVTLHVRDVRALRPVYTGLALLDTVRALWPDSFAWTPRAGTPSRFISLLAGSGVFEDDAAIPPLSRLMARWEADSAAFAQRKAAYHLY